MPAVFVNGVDGQYDDRIRAGRAVFTADISAAQAKEYNIDTTATIPRRILNLWRPQHRALEEDLQLAQQETSSLVVSDFPAQ